ncbi:hypothetical protein [Leifsonia sp. Leaf264]|uniref:hypothetical protein n=1 Tax=Leifsonia sp. Leaf264 TaxID=1736314 RepID=UPI0006FC9324|nr:hypothetical protein [Leifsonia sp. Leaf264]KQO98751.1 hypothetical protein ASF30_11865 [Leifsonia sp. Leaf264]
MKKNASLAQQWDRTVYAVLNGVEVVRYDRASKWYAENSDGTRKLIPIAQAVEMAVEAATTDGSHVAFDRLGGLFGKKVRAGIASREAAK